MQKRKKSISYDTYYEVFARLKPEHSLSHIGCLTAPNEEMATAQTRLMYSEKPWVELCVMPRSAIITIISGSGGGIGAVQI